MRKAPAAAEALLYLIVFVSSLRLPSVIITLPRTKYCIWGSCILQIKPEAGVNGEPDRILSAVCDEICLGKIPGQGGLEVEVGAAPELELDAAECFRGELEARLFTRNAPQTSGNTFF